MYITCIHYTYMYIYLYPDSIPVCIMYIYIYVRVIYVYNIPKWHDGHSRSFQHFFQSEALVSQPAIGLLLRCSEPPGDPIGYGLKIRGQSSNKSQANKVLENRPQSYFGWCLRNLFEGPPTAQDRGGLHCRLTKTETLWFSVAFDFSWCPSLERPPEHGKPWAVSEDVGETHRKKRGQMIEWFGNIYEHIN